MTPNIRFCTFLQRGFFFVVLVAAISHVTLVDAKGHHGGSNFDCKTKAINITDEKEYVYVCHTNQTFDVVIRDLNKDSEGILLEFDAFNTVYGDKFDLSYSTDGANWTSLLTNLKNVSGEKYFYFTGYSWIKLGIVFNDKEKKANRGTTLHFQSGCNMNMSTGDIMLPNYPQIANKLVHCSIQYNRPISASVATWNVSGKTNFKMDTNVTDFNTAFDTKTPPNFDFIGNKPKFLFDLDMSVANQSFVFEVDVVSPECSSMEVALSEQVIKYEVGSSEAGESVHCRWLLKRADADVAAHIHMSVVDFNFIGPNDLLTVVDAGKASGHVIAQVSVANLQSLSQPIDASGQYVLIMLTGENCHANESFHMNVETKNGGGRIPASQGEFLIQGDYPYVIFSNKTERIALYFEGSDFKLPAGASVQILDGDNMNAMELAHFDAKSTLHDVFSTGTLLMLNVVGLPANPKPIKVSFGPIPQNSCNRSTTATAGDMLTWEAGGLCNNVCSWNVKPALVNDSYNLVFSITQAASGRGMLRLGELEDQHQVKLNMTKVQAVSIMVPAPSGVLMRYKSDGLCATGPLRAIYTVSHTNDQQLSGALDSAFHVMSPLYPSPYPLGGSYAWHLSPIVNATNFHVTFDSFDLLPEHSLNMTFNGKWNSFAGSKLPRDLVFHDVDSNGVLLRLDTHFPDKPNSRLTAYGFDAEVMPLKCADVIGISFGDIKTLTNANQSGKICVFFVESNTPRVVDNQFALQLNFTVSASGANAANIKKNVSQYLEIYDGPTIRAKRITNVTLGRSQLSTASAIIIRYPYNDNKTIIRVDLRVGRCGLQAQCNNTHTCMLPWWECNGINDCGDNSDEMFCNNPGPTPTPGPAPEPTSHGWKTAFWLCVPLALIIGIVCTKMMPVMQQRWRDRQYAQFHDLTSD